MQTPLFEVTAAAASGDPRRLTTAANVRATIGSPAGDDTLLTTLIDRVSAQFATFCGLATDAGTDFPTFGAETCRATWFVEHLLRDPYLGRHSPLFLPWRKPITVSGVNEGGVDLTAGEDFVVESGGLLYRLSGGEARIRWPGAKVVVTYQAGYSLPASVPPDLEAAAIEQVKYLYKARKRDGSVLSETVPEVYQATFAAAGGNFIGASGLLTSVEGALAPYARPGML
jgi:hypothetical protein